MSGRMLRMVGMGLLCALGLATAAQAQRANVLGESQLMNATPTPGPLSTSTSTASVEFLVGSQSLILYLPTGQVPRLTERRRPFRLEVEFPGTSSSTGGAAFATGVVARYDVVHVGDRTRAILYLRSALRSRPVVAYFADRVVISVVPTLAPAPEGVAPTAPVTYPSPKTHITPIPTGPPVPFGPTPRITPVPVPSSAPAVPRDIPPISAVTAEVQS